MKSTYFRRLGAVHLAVLDLSPMCLPGMEGMLIPRINVPRYTTPDGKQYFRGKGIATDLLDECVADADAEQVTLWLEVSPSDGLDYDQLVAWYTRHGFQQHEKHAGLMFRTPRTSNEQVR